MRTVCPGCGAVFANLDDKHLGRKARCKKCGASFIIRPDTAGNSQATLPADTGIRRPAEPDGPPEPARQVESARPPGPMETIVSGASQTALMDDVAEDVPANTRVEPGPAVTRTFDNTKDQLPGATVVDDYFASTTSAEKDESSVPAEWKTGDVILELYEVLGLLGEGGMGKVYKVRHLGWNTELAVKSPKPEELERAGGAENFEREAETWVNLGLHPNTVSCYYIRRLGGVPRVFAEYVDSGSMQDWIQQGKLTDIDSMLDVAIQFAWGLDYAHNRGIVHQDIKPANVMMSGKGVAKVTDFGLAKARGIATGLSGDSGSPGDELVAYGGMTPAYCSPEQAEKKQLSRKTDMWSWALSILEMFTGEVTWMYGVAAAEALEEYLENGSGNESIPPMPDQVAGILKRCFDPAPDRRPETMMEIASELAGLYADLTGSAYPRRATKAGKATADSLNNRAISFLDLGRQREAEGLWREALSNEPHHPQSTFNLGLAQWRTGRLTDIDFVRWMEEAARSHGVESDSEYYLGLLHLERDDCGSAVKSLGKRGQAANASDEAGVALMEAKARLETSMRQIALFEGHTACVTSVDFNPGSGHLLTGSDDNRSKLWDYNSGEALRDFVHGSCSVTCVALGGGLAISGSYKSAKLWDVSTGEMVREINNHPDWVTSVGLSDDGRRAMTAGWDGVVNIMDTSSGRVIQAFDGVSGFASVNFNAGLVLFTSEDNTAKIVDIDTGAMTASIDVGPGALAISPDGSQVALADIDNSIHIYQAGDGGLVAKLEGHKAAVTTLAITPDGRHLVSGGYDKTLALWEIKTGRRVRTFLGHRDTVNAAVVCDNGNSVTTGSWDATARAWSIRGRETYRAPMMVSRVRASEMVLSAGAAYEAKLDQMRSALDKGDTIMATRFVREARSQMGFRRGAEAVQALGKLYLLLPKKGLNGGWESRAFVGHTGEVTSVSISGDCKYTLSSSHDRTLRLWDVSDGSQIRTLEGHTDRVNSADISTDGKTALSASGDGTLRVWETQTGKTTMVIKGHIQSVNSAVIVPGGDFAFSGGEDTMVKLWDMKSGGAVRSMRGHQGPVLGVAVSPDGRLALSSSEDRTARLWDLASGRCLGVFSAHTGAVNSVVFSPDSTRAVTASDDMTIIVWDIRTAKPARVMRGHTAPVTCVAASLDGSYLFSSDTDRVVRFWNMETGENPRAFEGHTSAVKSVAVSPDGRFAISCGEDRMVKMWTLDWELEERGRADWDDVAAPYMVNFLTLHTPPAGVLPDGRDPFEKEIVMALTRIGKPEFTDDEYDEFYMSLRYAGLGYLSKEGVRDRLELEMNNWDGPPPLSRFAEVDHSARGGLDEMDDNAGIELDEEEKDVGRTLGVTRFLKNLTTIRRKD